MSFTMPTTINGATITDKQYCVVSILDQRKWGTCVDLQFNANGATAPPSTNPTVNNNVVSDLTGTYAHASTGATCDKSQDGALCCCLSGSLDVVHNRQANTASVTGNVALATDPSNGCQMPQNFTIMSATISSSLTPRSGSAGVLIGTTTVIIDPMSVTASAGSVTLGNTSPNAPRVCSTTFTTSSSAGSYFSSAASSTTTLNSSAAAAMIPIVLIAACVVVFLLRNPIRACLSARSTPAKSLMWTGFGLELIVAILVLAACIADHWSKTSGLSVGPWRACVGPSCDKTTNLPITGMGSVQATRFFILTSVFPALGVLSLPFLVKYYMLSEARAALAAFWSMITITVFTFTAMCVWAAFQYDVLAKYTTTGGKWSPDWALGLCCLAWIFGLVCSTVLYTWKLKADGGSALQQTKAKEQPSMPTSAPPAAAPTHMPPPRTMPPTAAPPAQSAYVTPQPLYAGQQQYDPNAYAQPQYEGQAYDQQQYDQQQYGQQQQYDQQQYGQQQYGQPEQRYGQPGVDV